ncbi:hypothetical protein E2C01_072585 [Portunus trituberculatus]|uniref:Uncharacterized protein n=1 Tax=Portunus trituberculatus TaxID=210409 RepID=A0A5B7I9C2_PORTR|nr:hypothetical protein [Portunus trituberculatus]
MGSAAVLGISRRAGERAGKPASRRAGGRAGRQTTFLPYPVDSGDVALALSFLDLAPRSSQPAAPPMRVHCT